VLLIGSRCTDDLRLLVGNTHHTRAVATRVTRDMVVQAPYAA
jgi:hypothetical protein